MNKEIPLIAILFPKFNNLTGFSKMPNRKLLKKKNLTDISKTNTNISLKLVILYL